MRNALVQRPERRSPAETRTALRIAIRQLERADLYLASVASMELGDDEAEESVDCLREDLEVLRRHLVDERARLAE